MRKLGKKNYLLFTIFAIIVVILIVLFVLGINFVSKQNNDKYLLSENIVVFDANNSTFLSSSDSYIYLNWNKNYYYNGKDGSKNIGEFALAFDKNSKNLLTYGNLYNVSLSGKVNLLENENKISTNNASFYKIDDRRYLFVDSLIVSDNNSIKTSNFLLIEINKNGNASFYNDEINMNTIKPIKLIGTKFTFDIANEAIIVNNLRIDLKNIIGSTNTYQEPEEEVLTATDYLTETLNKFITIEQNKENDNVSNGNNVTKPNENNDVEIPVSKWLNISSSSFSVNSITINYVVFDPNNEYESIYLLVTSIDGAEKYTVNLSKEASTYTLHNLNNDTQYRVELRYLMEGTDLVSDSILIKTSVPDYSIKITKLDMLNSKVFYEIKGNSSYVFDSGNLNVYVDGTVLYTVNLSNNELLQASKDVYSGVIDYSSFRFMGEIMLKVENLYYNTNLTNYSFYTKIVSR